MNDLYTEADNVHSINDLVNFIGNLKNSFPQNEKEEFDKPYIIDVNGWCNYDIPMYLDAMEAWIRALANKQLTKLEDSDKIMKPEWKTFAVILLMGATYE